MSNKDQDLEKMVDEWFEKNHPEVKSEKNVYQFPRVIDDQVKRDQAISPAPEGLIPGGAAVGAVARYKGIGPSMLKPAPDVFRPVKPGPIIPTSLTQEALSDIEHMLQSGSEKRSGVTGRQMESAHNWETQRQSMMQKKPPHRLDISKPIIEAGPMVPTESGIGVPKNVAVDLENQKKLQAIERQISASADQAAAARAGKLAGLGLGVGKVAFGGLGGALAAKDIYEAIKDMTSKGISTENALRLLSGTGGAAMLFPGLGLPLGLAAQIPEVGYGIMKKSQKAGPEVSQGMAGSMDPMGNPLP